MVAVETKPDRTRRPSPDPADARLPCVLIADDDDEMRTALAEMLRRAGYEVLEARNGAEVLEQVKESALCEEGGLELDAVVSDIRMPGRSGLDVLVAIRAVSPELPVVLITGFGDAETHAQARWMGATAVLDKPFDAEELRSALRTLVPAPRRTRR